MELGEDCEFVGTTSVECETGITYHQRKYETLKLKECPVDPKRTKFREADCTAEEKELFQSSLGGGLWVTVHSRPDGAFEINHAAQMINQLKIKDVLRLNKVIRYLVHEPLSIFVPRLDAKKPLRVMHIVDAAENEGTQTWPKGQQGRIIGLMEQGATSEPGHFATASWKTGKLKRVMKSSFDGETLAVIDGNDESHAIAGIVGEFEQGIKPTVSERLDLAQEGTPWISRRPVIDTHTDSNSLVQRVESAVLDPAMTKKRREDISDIKECVALEENNAPFHINGIQNPSDALTKKSSRGASMMRLLGLFKTGYYTPIQGG